MEVDIEKRSGIEPISIESKSDFEYLLTQIISGQSFAFFFSFHDQIYETTFLKAMNVDLNTYKDLGYYFDPKRQLHIAENSEGLTWISTMGLTSNNCLTGVKFLDSCTMQFRVLSLLIDKALELLNDCNVYDIESYSYGYVCELTPALFHNLLFYFEVFGKSYLELNHQEPPHTHKLSTILNEVKRQMKQLNHLNTTFHGGIITQFERLVEYTKSISDRFGEEQVKYNNNYQDHTVIIFQKEVLLDMKRTVDLSYDFITSYYYDRDEGKYLTPDLLNRLLKRAENEAEEASIRALYSCLQEE